MPESEACDRGTAPGDDDRAGCHTAGIGAEGPGDQRGGLGGNQGVRRDIIEEGKINRTK